MTHLFDTNAWLRVFQTPEEISLAARKIIDELLEPIGLSAISV